MQPTYRGVAFLLSLGTLPVACGEDKDPSATTDTGNGPSPITDVDPGDSSTTAPVDPTTAGRTTTDPSGTTAPQDSTSTGTSTSEPPDPTTSEPQATTFLTTNTTSEGTDDTGPPDFPPIEHEVCQEYVDHIVECFPRYRDYAGYIGYYCDGYINAGARADGPGCAAALEALFACFNALACADIDDEGNCVPEQMAVEVACPSFADVDTDTDTFGSDTDTESSSTG
jgi:hypothetical protein